MTYCLLVEDVWDAQVIHGIIKHRGQRFEIPHGPAERKRVLALAEEIRQSRRMSAVPRDYQDLWKCRRSGFTRACARAL
jgi:hypothetical protein